jgi:hypothetical protein
VKRSTTRRLRTVLRATLIALVVGTALVLINHGDHIAREPICDRFYLKCALSYVTPFLVSLVSAALISRERAS